MENSFVNLNYCIIQLVKKWIKQFPCRTSAKEAFLVLLKFFLRWQRFAFQGAAVHFVCDKSKNFLLLFSLSRISQTLLRRMTRRLVWLLSGVYTDATDETRTRRTSDVITMTFNAFSAAGYCRQLKADCRDLQKEADALRTELQSLSAEIK